MPDEEKAESLPVPVDQRRPSLWRFAREAGFLLAFGVVSFAARSSLADHYVVPSGSMIPTVAIGDRILVDKLAYGLRVPFTRVYAIPASGPSRGDVVVLDSPSDSTTLLKRVVAVPGDLVDVRSGRVFVNGELSDEPEEMLGMERGGGPDYGPLTLPPDQYLVMGDHRGDSLDGRFFGPVPRRSILGKAEGVFWREGHPAWHPL